MSPHKRLVITLSLILFSLASLAQAETYFEYAPDAWRSYRHAVSTAATPYQFFQSATDFTLTGFSFWVDNTGGSGSVTFTLLDEENTTLAQKIITLNQTPAVPGGTRIDITLDQPIDISHYRAYSIQISSTLIGFGLYYTPGINVLEHNLQYTTEYATGIAKLGSQQQNYTFKFALEKPTDDVSDSEEPPIEEITPTSSTPIATVISNARITAITDTTALAAWTTNLAADSRISVRSQLNPLYVYTTAYDDTLELEHALSITGLVPNSGYFVDFFSQQNESEPILTTYTVSFTTAAAAPGTAVPTTPTPSSTTQIPTTQTSSSPTTTNNTSSTSTLPPVTFGAGNGTDSFSINWQTPAGGAPNGGYRIDILDANHHLIRQLTAPTDATSRNIALLLPGDHEIIVYANKDGVYEKVAASTSFEAKEARSPLFWFWYLAGVVLSLLIATAFLFHRKEKTELAPLE